MKKNTQNLSLVTEVKTLEPISDQTIEEQIIFLLEESRMLRDELTNKKSAYTMAMQINHRLQAKMKILEAELTIHEIAARTFGNNRAA